MFPVAQAILRETFPLEEQGTAMGVFGFGIMLGPAVGPILGGWLTDHSSGTSFSPNSGRGSASACCLCP
jgi:DHA2 family multidrug resistance protein